MNKVKNKKTISYSCYIFFSNQVDDQIKVADVKKAVSHIKNKSDINEVNQELATISIDGVEKLEAFEIKNNKTDVTIKITIDEGKTIKGDSFVLENAIKDVEVAPESKYSITFEN